MRFLRMLPLLLAASLSACSDRSAKAPPWGEYKLPVAEVYNRLLANNFKSFRDNRQCGILIHIVPNGETPTSIIWRVASSNREMLWFRARLTALAPDRTKIDIEVGPIESNGKEAYDGSHDYWRPAVGQPVRPAIREQIASILESRPFNRDRAPRDLKDSICNVQQGGLESGHPFSVNDPEVKSIRPTNH